MRVVVTGSTGMIGQKLCQRLMEGGHHVVSLSRNPDSAREKTSAMDYFAWDAMASAPPREALEGSDAVVHLAGAPIAEGRWNRKRKALIRDSRVLGTRRLLSGISELARKPDALVSSSAIGFYGNRPEGDLDEESEPGHGYLAEVCQAWEAESLKAETLGIRTTLIRTGIVLSLEGGALAKMLTPFRFGLGGPVGSGKQWMSWIHIDDEVGILEHALLNASVSGVINATAPTPLRNAEFSKLLGKALNRPAFLPAPGFALKFALGEMAQSLLLEGQKVLPTRTLESGFEFRFSRLDAAFRDLLK